MTLLHEDFDGVATVDDLQGWEIGDGWAIDGATPSDGSGLQSLRISGNATGSAVTPQVDLRRLSEGSLSYLVRRTGAFDDDSLLILVSTDGGATFPDTLADVTETLPSDGGTWYGFSFNLPPSLLVQDEVRFQFVSLFAGSASANARFDDIMISGQALFDIEPPQGLFAAEPGESDQQPFILYNHGDDPLDVSAPELSGGPFSISPSDGAQIAPGESRAYSITFAPTEEGVFYDTLHVETASAGAVDVPLVGLTAANQVRFSSDVSTAGEADLGAPVDISISFKSDEANLQGVQLEVSWDDEALTLADVVPGAGVAGWSVSFEQSDQAAKVLVYDDNGTGIASGDHDPFLSLKFDIAVTNKDPRDATVTIDQVIGALATPTADDAELIIRTSEHTMSIEKREAVFAVSADNVDFGSLLAGDSAEETFDISNSGGERVLTISALSFSNGPYSIWPESAAIGPDESETFTVTFEPTHVVFGLHEATLEISHDAQVGASHSLPVRGIGTSGRGDNDGDGMVDAMDVVNSIDFILERADPTALQLTNSDLYPFEAGDGGLDVRDLSVKVQAIVRGVWPDDAALPVLYEPEIALALSKRAEYDSPVRVAAVRDGSEVTLQVEADEPLRALQLDLQVGGLAGEPSLLLNTPGSPTAAGRLESDSESGKLKILLYRPDGGSFKAGSYRFARLDLAVDNGSVEREYATAIGAANDRLKVSVEGIEGTAAAAGERSDRFTVGSPYPNPAPLGGGASINFPVAAGEHAEVRMTVFDLLGRKIFETETHISGRSTLSWGVSGESHKSLAPGLYLVRIASGSEVFVRRVVITR